MSAHRRVVTGCRLCRSEATAGHDSEPENVEPAPKETP